MKCEKCGAEFEPGDPRQRFCTRECQVRSLDTKGRRRTNQIEKNQENMKKFRDFYLRGTKTVNIVV